MYIYIYIYISISIYIYIYIEKKYLHIAPYLSYQLQSLSHFHFLHHSTSNLRHLLADV